MNQIITESNLAVPEQTNQNLMEGKDGGEKDGRSFRQAYLSACLLLGFSSSVPVASAHEAAFNTVLPVVPTVHSSLPGHSASFSHTGTALTKIWSRQSSAAGQAVTVSGVGALNLGSAGQSFTATQIGSFNTVTLDVGGKQVAFNLGGSNASQMTAAELVAAAEVTAGGRQTLSLSAQGQAVGGTIVLNQNTLSSLDSLVGGSLSSLLVPKNVTLVDKVSDINLSGNLVNYGKILVGANSAAGGDVISAADTYNLSGASISSGRGSDLTLVDSQGLINGGIISAGNNLYLNSANLTNSGALTAQGGNVNFNTPGALTLNNANGTVQASNNVNVRDASYTGTNGVAITGGTISSRQLNIFSGCGDVETSAVNITGTVNTVAGAAHIIADTPDLKVGTNIISGDPLFANQGNITINGNVIGAQNGADLSFVASGNIVSAGGSIDTSSSGNGGQINLIAGANFTSSGLGTITLLGGTSPTAGGSATGGLIDLTGKNGGSAPITAITSATTGAGNSAGNITMVAFAGSNKGSGTITIPASVTIEATGANGTSTGGNVTLIAGATGGQAITTGNINATGGADNYNFAAGGAKITLATGNAAVAGISVTQNGGLSAPINSYTASTPANITSGNLLVSSGVVSVVTAGNFTFGNIDVSGYGGNGSSLSGSGGGSVNIQANRISGGTIYAYGGGGAGGKGGTGGYDGGNGGSVTIAGYNGAGGSVNLTGSINTSGGGAGGGGGQASGGGSVGSGGNGGGAGTITVTVANNILIAGGIFDGDGGDGGRGSLALGGPTAGNGGGGGGSLGAGGGGGSAGQISTLGDTGGTGGGGGGGLFGGGGGAAQSTSLSNSVFLAGNGAGFGSNGSGGVGDFSGTAGGSQTGGNGANGGGNGGALYQGGLATGAAGSGVSAFLNGKLQSSVNSASVTLTTTGGTIGSAAAPLQVMTYQGSINGVTGYLSLPATTTLTTQLGNLAINVGQNASPTVNNYSDFAPGNQMGNANLLLASVGANADLGLYNYGNSLTVAGAVTGGANAYLGVEALTTNRSDAGNLIVNANVSALGNGYVDFYASGSLTAKGNFTAPGGVNLTADTGILSLTGNATATGPGGYVYIYAHDNVTVNGNLTGNTSVTYGAVEVESDAGPLTVNGNVTGLGNGGFIGLYGYGGPVVTSGKFMVNGANTYIELDGLGINAKGTYTAPQGYIELTADSGDEGAIVFNGTATAGGTNGSGYGIYFDQGYFPLTVSGSLTTTGNNGGIELSNAYNDINLTALMTTTGSNSPIYIDNSYGKIIASGNLMTTGAGNYVELTNSYGPIEFNGKITTTGNGSFIDLANEYAVIDVTGPLTTTGSNSYVSMFTYYSNLNVSGNISTNGTGSYVKIENELYGPINVTGNITTNGAGSYISLDIPSDYGSITANGNLSASGAGSYVSLDVGAYGNITVNGNLSATGTGSYIYEYFDSGNLTNNGNLTQSGAGNSTYGGIYVESSYGPISINGNVSSNGQGSSIYLYGDGYVPSNVTGNVTTSGPNSYIELENGSGALNVKGNLSANGSGSYLYLYADTNINLTGNGTASYYADIDASQVLTVTGNISATSYGGINNKQGFVDLYAGPSATIIGSITANGPGGVTVDTAGAFTQTKGGITAPYVDFETYSIGTSKTPVSVNSPSVQVATVAAENAYINDNSTQSTTLSLLYTSGGLNVLNFTSAGSSLLLTTSSTSPVAINYGTISDSNAAGTITVGTFNGGSLASDNSLILNSGGDINTNATANLSASGTVILNSKSGSVGSSAAAPFTLTGSPLISATTGKAGQVNLSVGGSPTLGTITAPTGINVQVPGVGNDISVSGALTAANGSVTLNAGGSIYSNGAAALLSGQNISLTDPVITSTIGTAAQYLNLSVLSPTGTIFLSSTGSTYINVVSGTVNLAAGSSVVDTLGIANTTGSLTLGTGGLTASSQAIDLSARTNLTLNAAFAGYTPGGESLVAGGLLTLPGGSLTVTSPDGVNGGSLTIQAATLSFTGKTLLLNADAPLATGGAGGTITFDLSGKTNYSIGTVGAAPQIVFENAGSTSGGPGSGGNTFISSGGALSVDQPTGLINAASNNGNGGIISISAAGGLTTSAISTAGNGTGTGGLLSLVSGGNLLVNGGLQTGIIGNTAYGDLYLSASGKSALQIDAAGSGNAVIGTIAANNIQISNPSGISLNAAVSSFGAVEFDTTNFAVGKSAGISGDTSLTFNSGSGSLSITGGNTVLGTPSTVTMISAGSLNAGQLFVAGSSVLTNLDTLTINAGGALTLGTNSLTLANLSAAPGTITITAASIITPTPSKALMLRAYGTLLDGDVSLTLTGSAPLTLGSGAGNVQINVAVPSGTPTAGGSVYVSNGGNLTYTAGSITTDSQAYSLNTNLSLLSAKNLQVQGFTQADFGSGANFNFASNSSSAFVIVATPSAPANGIQLASGILTANNLSISNSGGGIGSSPALPLTVDAAGLALNAKGAVYASDGAAIVALGNCSGSSFDLSATNSLNQGSGLISTKSLQLQAGTMPGTIVTNAASVSGAANLPNGNWSVDDTSTAAVSLGAIVGTGSNSSVNFQTAGPLTTAQVQAANVSLTAGSGITVNEAVGQSGGTTSLSAGGGKSAIVTGKTGVIDGGNISLQAGTGGIGGKSSALAVDGGNLALLSPGAINISDSFKGSTAVDSIAQAVQSITLNSQGSVSLGTIFSTGNITVSSAGAGGLTVGTKVDLSTSNGSISLTASSTATVATTGASLLATNGTISLTGGDINVDKNSTLNSTGNITLASAGATADTVAGTITSSGGNIAFTSTGKGAVTVGGTLTGLNVTFNAANASIGLTNALLTATDAKGAVNLVAANTGTGTLSLTGSSLYANGGGINLSGAGVSFDDKSSLNTSTGGVTITSAGTNTIGLNGFINSAGAVLVTNSGTGSTVTIGDGTNAASITGSSISINQATGADATITAAAATVLANNGPISITTNNDALSLSASSLTAGNGAVTLTSGTNTLSLVNSSITTNTGNISLTGNGVSTDAKSSLTANNGNIAITAQGASVSDLAGSTTANNAGSITLTNSGSAVFSITNFVAVDQGSITLTVDSPTNTGGSFATSSSSFTTGTGNITVNLNETDASLTSTGSIWTAGFAPGGGKGTGSITFNLNGNNSFVTTPSSKTETQFNTNFGDFTVNLVGQSSGMTLNNGTSVTTNVGNISVIASSKNSLSTFALGDISPSVGYLTAEGGNITIAMGGSKEAIFAYAGSQIASYGGNVSITTAGSGSSINLSQGAATGIIAANDGSVTISSGSTAAANTFIVDAAVTAGNGNINITNAGPGVTAVSGTLTTRNGSLNILDTNAGGAIDIGQAEAATANITNGNVTIQNTANNNGIITLEASTNIHASATAPTLGNVTVADGTFKASMLTAQSLLPPYPTNVTYNSQPGGAIYFATSTPAGQPDFANPGNVLNANGRAVTLFVGGATGQIQLNGNVTLTADPPPATAIVNAMQGASPVIGSGTSHSAISTEVDTSFISASPMAVTASLSPAPGVLTGQGSGPGNPGNQLAVIQSSTLASLNNLLSGTLGEETNSTAGLFKATYAQQATESESGPPALGGGGGQTTNVLYGGVSAHGKKTVVAGQSSLKVKQLNSGAHLLSPDQDTLLETPMGTVFVAKGALALVVSDKGSLSVYNFDDTARDAVLITVGREKIRLAPGRHVTITSSSVPEFERVNPIKTLGYRSVTSRKLGDSLTVHSSEFSLMSAMATIAPVKTLISSADHNQKKVGQHLLKTAAILQTISTQRDPFLLKTPPEATAMR